MRDRNAKATVNEALVTEMRARRRTKAGACKVCDGESVVAVGDGEQTDLVDCPACVGVRRGHLTSAALEDAIAMCAAEGVVIRIAAAPATGEEGKATP